MAKFKNRLDRIERKLIDAGRLGRLIRAAERDPGVMDQWSTDDLQFFCDTLDRISAIDLSQATVEQLEQLASGVPPSEVLL